MPGSLVVSRKENAVRMDAENGEGKATTLLENLGGGLVLASVFDHEGNLLSRKVVNTGSEGTAAIERQVSTGFETITQGNYRDIVLEKDCPKCGNKGMARSTDISNSIADVPVMPLVICQSCGTKGYTLSDSYLREMVMANKELFSSKEQEELERDAAGFMAELREYIIRIFASKRIFYIR